MTLVRDGRPFCSKAQAGSFGPYLCSLYSPSSAARSVCTSSTRGTRLRGERGDSGAPTWGQGRAGEPCARPRREAMDARSSDDRAEDDDRGTRDRGTRALYARHVVRRGRVDLPWSPDERAVAPLLGGVATFPRLAGEALARRALKTRELYLYHSGRATARTSFSLPDDALRLVFDALARVSVEKAGPEPDGWDRDEALFTAVLRSVWVEKFSLSSTVSDSIRLASVVRPISTQDVSNRRRESDRSASAGVEIVARRASGSSAAPP